MAHVAGITMRTTATCPHLRGVVIDPDTGALVRTLEYKATKGESTRQLHEIAQYFESQLAVEPLAAVVIREAGYSSKTTLSESVKNRYRAEGLCIAIARVDIAYVEVLDVQAIGRKIGKSGDAIKAAGEAIVGGDFTEAATAALAAAAL